MTKRKHIVHPTIDELQAKHTEIINDQFLQLDNLQKEIDAINSELKGIRLLLPQMRSPKILNQLAKRQEQLIELATKLNENRTITFMACLIPLAAIAKIIENDSKPSETEAPPMPAPQPKISDEDLKSMYKKYED